MVKPRPVTSRSTPGRLAQDLALAGLPLAFDELKEEDAHAIARGANGESDGGGGLALAVASKDERQAVAWWRHEGNGTRAECGTQSAAAGDVFSRPAQALVEFAVVLLVLCALFIGALGSCASASRVWRCSTCRCQG